jgi:hypothetical protein
VLQFCALLAKFERLVARPISYLLTIVSLEPGL